MHPGVLRGEVVTDEDFHLQTIRTLETRLAAVVMTTLISVARLHKSGRGTQLPTRVDAGSKQQSATHGGSDWDAVRGPRDRGDAVEPGRRPDRQAPRRNEHAPGP